MKNLIKNILFVGVTLIFLPPVALAHQPLLVESRVTAVPSPEISKAYYGKLSGVPDTYSIHSDTPFNLYVNVLVPDIAGQKKDISAIISKDGVDLAKLDGTNFEWKKFYEPFGADTYWMGPEYKSVAEPGNYEVRVFSTANDSKYSLAIGELEVFDTKETLSALKIIPELKKNFFDESPIGFIKSPMGWGFILILYVLAFVFGFAYRFILRKFAKGSVRGLNKNIGKSDRLIRLAIGVGLILVAVATTWNPILIFLSGFCLFEAIFSWCGLNAALGKSTCDVG